MVTQCYCTLHSWCG